MQLVVSKSVIPAPGRLATVLVVALGLGLAGCQTSGQGAATGAAIGGGLGCGIGAAVSDSNPAAGCLIGGLFGALVGGMIGDAIEREQLKKSLNRTVRSGRGASTGTFRNSKGQRVVYRTTVKKTYKKPDDPGLTCRDVQYAKTVEGQAAGTSTKSACQARVANKPTWQDIEV